MDMTSQPLDIIAPIERSVGVHTYRIQDVAVWLIRPHVHMHVRVRVVSIKA